MLPSPACAVTVALAFKTYTVHGIDAPLENQIFIVSSMTVRLQDLDQPARRLCCECCEWKEGRWAGSGQGVGSVCPKKQHIPSRASCTLSPRNPAPSPSDNTLPCLHLHQSVILFTVVLGAFTSGLVGRLLGQDELAPGATMPTLPSMDPDSLK